MNIDGILIKEYEGKPYKELVNAPVYALEGITPLTAKGLENDLGIGSIGDLAKHKCFRAAAAIAELSQHEN